MHVAVASSVALLAVVLSNMIAAFALGLDIGSAVLSVHVAPAVFIAAAGFGVLVLAELLPVLRVVRETSVRFLSD